jgi:hypothetical protein
MEFYSAIKRNEILSLACKWKKLENINISEVLARFRKSKATYFLFYG